MSWWRASALGAAVALTIAIGLFVGVEETPREHTTDYELFLKQAPTPQIIFRNPAVCGECDVEPFESLKPDVQDALSGFCRVRFGIPQPRACYAIYLELQRMAREGRTDSTSR